MTDVINKTEIQRDDEEQDFSGVVTNITPFYRGIVIRNPKDEKNHINNIN